ncbi:MAG: hypothetical protein UU89_C0006G0001 [Parcubacteria group bacterium GW2011_GWC2_42_11]|nr:MAG: hypothetical protein UU89_C0006G0001 [Parcubacteria group bacterium GW2011_GWC2_42_11]
MLIGTPFVEFEKVIHFAARIGLYNSKAYMSMMLTLNP